MSIHSRPIRISARQLILLAAMVVPLVVSAVYLQAGARTGSGAPMLPLDDSYIHLQYAWQAAHGQFLQYNPGDTPTSGATSLLYMLVVALGFFAGISHDAMPAAVLVFGLILFVISALTLTDLTRWLARWMGLDENLLAVATIILFAGSGWMAWAYLSGMETGVLMTLVIVALWASVVRRIRLMALASALAALTRPEAALLPLALFLAELAFPQPDGAGRARATGWLAASLGAVAVSPAVNYLYTGSATATGTLAKSVFTLVPFQWSAVWAAFSASMLEIWLRLFGGPASDGHWHTFPLLQLLAIGGLLLLSRTAPGRRLALVGVVWCVLGTAASATLETALWHHYRYQMPYYPALLLLAGLGYVYLATRWQHDPRRLWLVTLVPLVAWSAYSLADFRQAYTRDSQTAADMQLVLALWLRANTPPSARIAVHDVGVVRYFSDRATIDVVGLTTADMAPAYRNGPGSLYEALAQLQPDYYAVYPVVTPPYFGISSSASLLGHVLLRVHVDNYSPYTSAGDTQVITEPDWSKAELANRPQQPSIRALVAGLDLVDAVNVADLKDEQRHGFTWWNVGEPAGFPTDVRVQTYRQDPSITLADGGRVVNGGDSFTLAVKPAMPLTLVARLHQTADMILGVTVNGADAGDWRVPAVPGQWLESAFSVDPKYLRGGSAKFVLTVKQAAVNTRYGPFYYWAYQGAASAQPAVTPQHPASAAFGTIATLVGFDAPGTLAAPGQELDLTLYWRPLEPDRTNYQVFVHLANPTDDSAAGILTQAVEAPLAGTDPFWVWTPGQTVSEPIRLTIPPQARPGKYLLFVGIYNADSGERLPITGAPDFGSARLALGEVDIR